MLIPYFSFVFLEISFHRHIYLIFNIMLASDGGSNDNFFMMHVVRQLRAH